MIVLSLSYQKHPEPKTYISGQGIIASLQVGFDLRSRSAEDRPADDVVIVAVVTVLKTLIVRIVPPLPSQLSWPTFWTAVHNTRLLGPVW